MVVAEASFGEADPWAARTDLESFKARGKGNCNRVPDGLSRV